MFSLFFLSRIREISSKFYFFLRAFQDMYEVASNQTCSKLMKNLLNTFNCFNDDTNLIFPIRKVDQDYTRKLSSIEFIQQ